MGVKQEDVPEMSKQTLREPTQVHDHHAGRDNPAAPLQPDATASPFEAALRRALEANRIADARTLVANAEAVLAAHAAAAATPSEVMTKTQVAAAKARIAIATGDGAAARAILVRAIEGDPTAPVLKALMTEVMLATGRAADVRPVLQHLGNRPAATRSSTDESLTPPPVWRDTSG